MAVRRMHSKEDREKVRDQDKGLKWMKILNSS